MSLLAEMNNIIKENAEKTLNINGNMVTLQDVEAEHAYHPGQLLFHATQTDPEEWSDDETSALTIHSLSFDVKTKNKSYSVSFDFGDGEDYHENQKQLPIDMKNITPYILDEDDNEIKDMQTLTTLRGLCIQYVTQSNLVDDLYQNANQKELDRDNYNEPDDDYDREVPQFYDGTGRF